MLLRIYALIMSTHWVAAIFFHENSAVDLKGEKNTSAYGFSLGYQRGDAKLVIGAPRYNNEGKVYQCPVQNIKQETGTCNNPVDIKFGDPLKYDRNQSPDQNFYLGASIAATTNGFVVCAPLRTFTSSAKYSAYGVCFEYHNNTAKVWDKHSDYNLVSGGAGWSTLSDEENDRIIVSRFFKKPDAVYTQMSKPENFTSCKHTNTSDVAVTIYGQAMSFGNYFDTNKTTYAFSATTLLNEGNIDLVSSTDLETNDTWSLKYTIQRSDSVGTMFGAALCSADVTRDGLAELFVGAPAQAIDNSNFYNTGAVHVYTKSNSKTEQMINYLTIWGVMKNGAWFGSALSTNDVNADSYPEIIVSAPFENSGGVMYIICGFALYMNKRTTISVMELPRTQIIERSWSFGFSLQPVADYNENGSDELAVGAPETSTVTMYQGVPAITANVTSEFRNYATDTNTEFSFSSCVTIQKPEKPENITTRLSVENVISGENAVFKNAENATYEISLNEPTNITGNLYQYCKDFTIKSPLSCKVNTTVSLAKGKGNIETDPEFNNTWVTLSPQSCLTKETQPQCNCGGEPCSPLYSVELQLAGRTGSNHKYVVGSSDQETVTIIVRNSGTMGCGACAIVRVLGSLVRLLPCWQEGGEYRCDLPTPFRAATNKTIDVQLLTNTLSNKEKSLQIDVEVRKECTKSEAIKSSLSLDYDFSNVLENVIINGSTVNRTISEMELHDTGEDKVSVEQTFTTAWIYQLQKPGLTKEAQERGITTEGLTVDQIRKLLVESVKAAEGKKEQEKPISRAMDDDPDKDKIFNHQPFKWNNVLLTIKTDTKPYIHKSTVRMRHSMDSCENSTDSSHKYWKCSINFAPNSTTEITVADTIIKKDIESYLQSANVKIESKLTLELIPVQVKEKSILTLIILEKEHKEKSPVVTIIVAIVVALLVLLVIAFILYKLNFFKRKNKEDLEELKKEIRKRSVRSAYASESQPEAGAAAVAEAQDPEHDFDTVDLIVDETPLKRALSSEELNSIAACVESEKMATACKNKNQSKDDQDHA